MNKMGRLSVLLDGENSKEQVRLSSPSYLTDEKISEINTFLAENSNSLEKGYIDVLSNYLVQANGYFNQLLLKGDGIVSSEDFAKYKEQAQELTNKESDKSKENLEEVLKKYFTLYKEFSANLQKEMTKNDDNKKLAELVSSVNDLFTKIDNSYVETDTNVDSNLLPLVDLYKRALASDDTNKLANLTLLLDEEKRIIAKDKEAKEIAALKAESKEQTFDLFDKINDQIVDKDYKKVDNLIYARYKLEDGSYYYAIVEDNNTVLSEEQEFKTFTNFVMNQEETDKNLKIIVNNVIVYYNLNEYTRYVEMIYKKQMTKEIDDAIAQYKTRLLEMEKILKGQLDFIEDISPILNGKPSDKFPGIIYNDTPIKQLYSDTLNDTSLIDDATKEKRKLMVRLSDDTVSNEITTKDVLTVIYGPKKVEELVLNFSEEHKEAEVTTVPPVVAVEVQEPAKQEEPVAPSTITTNYQKLSDYIETREKELMSVNTSGNNDVKIEEDKAPLYQNVNAIFDLNMAAAISDNQYRNGQGIFALTHYLKTGEANRFTSSYNARAMASSVKPNNYTSLLLENMIKSFAGSGKKAAEDPGYVDRMQQILSFVKDELSKNVFSAEDMKNDLLSNDNLLQSVIKNFDYDYLDPTSENSKLYEQSIETGVNNNNSSAIRIKQAVADVKALAKSDVLLPTAEIQNKAA